jgi:hypothetical protein
MVFSTVLLTSKGRFMERSQLEKVSTHAFVDSVTGLATD